MAFKNYIIDKAVIDVIIDKELYRKKYTEKLYIHT